MEIKGLKGKSFIRDYLHKAKLKFPYQLYDLY